MGGAFIPESIRGEASQVYPFQSLPEAFRAINFDPSGPGNAFFVVIADVHYGTKNSTGINPAVEEVNRMQYPPAFFCVNGDLIVTASRSFGHIPGADERKQAIEELRSFQGDVSLLNPEIPLRMTLGNHDTHPGESDPEIFWEVFPGYPPYQAFDVCGMHIICLNGHSTGYIDPNQMEWLGNDVRAQPKEKGIILFIHQPSMHHTIRERGIPDAISQVLSDHTGLVWLIGGHDHTNSEELFLLPETVLIQHRITCGATRIWGDDERPGYWIYCLRNGEVTGRVFRRMPEGYRLQPAPEISAAIPLPIRIGTRDNAIWRCLVGENDHPYRVSVKAADCLNYWAYVKELIYKAPIRKAGSNKPVRLVLYASFKIEADIKRKDQYFLSKDGETWEEYSPYRTTSDSAYLEAGKHMQHCNELYIKFTPVSEAAFAGMALLS